MRLAPWSWVHPEHFSIYLIRFSALTEIYRICFFHLPTGEYHVSDQYNNPMPPLSTYQWQ